MILGIDAGGTNIDVVGIDDDEVTAREKVPNRGVRESVENALTAIRIDWSTTDVERIVVTTTVVVNAAVQNQLPDCTTLLIPGPGLAPDRSFYGDENEVLPGCVDHRGRITEDVHYEGEPDTPVVSIVSKFAARNPELERTVRAAISIDDDCVALGNESGAVLTFPQRAATTTANAKTRPAFVEFQTELDAALNAVGLDAPVYYLKGDGAMLGERTMRTASARTLKSSAAASTLGLLALSGSEDAVCVDIGGTTTDVARATDGFLDLDANVRMETIEPEYDGVVSASLPVGGDTRIVNDGPEPGFSDQREGNAVAFGGDTPTLTDALYVIGEFEDGDGESARSALAEVADGPLEVTTEAMVDRYAERVASTVDDIATSTDADTNLVVGGVLAPYLAGRIADRSSTVDRWEVPPCADVAGAIGCAVARVSLEVEIRIDSSRAVMTITSIGPEIVETIPEGRTYTDEELVELATTKTREATRDAGGDPEGPFEILATNRFDVVQHRRIVGEIVDVRARAVPGFELVSPGES